MSERFVIVGAGATGGSAAATLRREGFEGRVVLLGAEAHPPYDRPPLSKEYLRGEVPFARSLREPADFYPANDIERRPSTQVVRVLPDRRVVELSEGEAVPYDKLLVATGGRNRRLGVPGADLEGILDLRTVEDADRIRNEIGPGRRAVVVGMGFIGAEVTASLRQSGVEVVGVEPQDYPLQAALGAEVGRVLEGLHRDHGVKLHLGDSVRSFEGERRVAEVVTTAGRRLGCDFVVVGVGIEPVTEVVMGTGIELEDGIVTDELCRTRVAGIFAAGDVANHYHPVAGRRLRVEHWQNALLQGEAAARSMLGKGSPYDEIHWFWSDQYEATLTYAGFPGPWDQLVVRGSLEDRDFVAYYGQAGRLQASVAIGRSREVRRSMPLIQELVPMDDLPTAGVRRAPPGA